MMGLTDYADDNDGWRQETLVEWLKTRPEVAEEIRKARSGGNLVKYSTIVAWLRDEYGVTFGVTTIRKFVTYGS